MHHQSQKVYYKDKKDINLHPLVMLTVQLCDKTDPCFPNQLVKKIGQQLGLQIYQPHLCSVLGHYIDYNMDKIMKTIKQSKTSKKQQSNLYKSDVIKALNFQNIYAMDFTNVCEPYYHIVESLEKPLNELSLQQKQQLDQILGQK